MDEHRLFPSVCRRSTPVATWPTLLASELQRYRNVPCPNRLERRQDFLTTNRTNLTNKSGDQSKVPRGRPDVSPGYQPGNTAPQQEMESQRDGPKTNPNKPRDDEACGLSAGSRYRHTTSRGSSATGLGGLKPQSNRVTCGYAFAIFPKGIQRLAGG